MGLSIGLHLVTARNTLWNKIALQWFMHKCSNKMFCNSTYIAINTEYVNMSGKYSIV